jgi:hypothetical protein
LVLVLVLVLVLTLFVLAVAIHRSDKALAGIVSKCRCFKMSLLRLRCAKQSCA